LVRDVGDPVTLGAGAGTAKNRLFPLVQNPVLYTGVTGSRGSGSGPVH